jgi:glycosyltransferase involved in cell wall biosynthesis
VPDPTESKDVSAERLTAAERRVDELAAELAREREKVLQLERRLATKEREVLDIHRSRAWGFVGTLRSLKVRGLDPLLGMFGLAWPRPRPSAASSAAVSIAPQLPHAYDVICFSTCNWDDRFQRPQQLMLRFAEAGHRVFFVSPQFRQGGPSWSAVVKAPNVYEVTLRGPALNVYAQLLGDRTRDALFDGLDALRREASMQTAAMFLQLPFWWPLARHARERFGWPVLYDCMDLHAGFATVRQSMVAQEEALLSGSDVVIVSSGVLERHALRKRDDVLVLRNACDFEHFAKTARPNNVRPVIGYYGAISDWFDSALVAELASRRPDWDFVLVGSTYNADLSRLAKLPNVSLPGEESYHALPEVLGRFDVAIIPFKRTPLTEATNPVKVYEMLAAGKPIVSVPLPEVAALAPLVRLASNAMEFEQAIAEALTDDAQAADARRAFARGQTWQHRFEVLQAATAAALGRKT